MKRIILAKLFLALWVSGRNGGNFREKCPPLSQRSTFVTSRHQALYCYDFEDQTFVNSGLLNSCKSLPQHAQNI